MSEAPWLAPVSPDIVWFDGADAKRFLNDLISQEIGDMRPGETRRSFLLGPQGKLDIVFADAGEQLLKNIARPVRIYSAHPDGAGSVAPPPLALSHAAFAFAYVFGDLASAKAVVEQAVALNPNLAAGWATSECCAPSSAPARCPNARCAVCLLRAEKLRN